MPRKLTHEEFVRRVENTHDGYTVRGQYINCSHKVSIECDKGHIWDANPKSLWNGTGCPYCAGQRAIIGETDLWTTRPDVARLLKNIDDGYQYCCNSHRKTIFICPNCMNENLKRVGDVCTYGFACSFCSDGVSFPNKFGYAFLQQLPIESHVREYNPDWASPYKYDNYFVYRNNEYILEMDGALHYKEVASFGRTLEQVQEIDRIKTDVAENHGIHVIRIECINTTCDYIKSNILLSELNGIFDLSSIDWVLCDAKAQKNLIKEACDLYMSGLSNLRAIASVLHIHHDTVRRYLKNGVKFGWCNYNPDQVKKSMRDKISKPVMIVDENENILDTFESLASCTRAIKNTYGIMVNAKSIVRSCKTHKPYKGFNFRFANKTIQN